MPKKAENPPIKNNETSIWLIIFPYMRPPHLAKLNCFKFTLTAVEHWNSLYKFVLCPSSEIVAQSRMQDSTHPIGQDRQI